MSSPRMRSTVPPCSLATNTVPFGASDASCGTVPVMICGSAGRRAGRRGQAHWRSRPEPARVRRAWRAEGGGRSRAAESLPVTTPVSALIRTSSLGLRLATATVRVCASTTTPSGASPTGICMPGMAPVGAGRRCGSAGGGRSSAGGRVPSVGTPVGSRPVVVGGGAAALVDVVGRRLCRRLRRGGLAHAPPRARTAAIRSWQQYDGASRSVYPNRAGDACVTVPEQRRS